MRRSTSLLLAALSVSLMAGCDGPPPKSGYVKKLAFHDRWTETIWSSVCVSYNSQGFCTVSVPVSTGTVDHPPQWCLLLVDDKDKKHEGEVCMDPGTYAKYRVGMHYPDAR